MDTALIDSAITLAVSSAQALTTPVNIAAAPVSNWPDGTTATVQTQTLRNIHGSGFRVIGLIVFPNGYRAQKIVNHIANPPAETAWPADIEAASAQFFSDSIVAGETQISTYFWGSRLTDMATAYLGTLTALGGNTAALAAAKPILAALHAWVYSVRAQAMTGNLMFPKPPHTYEQFVLENH